jgi:hypothetical protein
VRGPFSAKDGKKIAGGTWSKNNDGKNDGTWFAFLRVHNVVSTTYQRIVRSGITRPSLPCNSRKEIIPTS